MVNTRRAEPNRGEGGVPYSKTKKVKNKNAVSVSPEKVRDMNAVAVLPEMVNNKNAVAVSSSEKWKGILRKKKVAGRTSGNLTEDDPFGHYIQSQVAKKKAEGYNFAGNYRGMLVPMVFEIVSKCISCVLLVPLDPRLKTNESRAFLQPACKVLYTDWYGTVTVQGNNSKVDCDGELLHKVVELLPANGEVKRVGGQGKYYSYIFAFAVNHCDMEKEVADEYIVSVAQKFGEILSENMDDDSSPSAKKRVFAADEVYEMKSIRVCQMIRDDDVFRVLDDVVSFSEEGKARTYEFGELLAIPEMKEILEGAFGKDNVDGKQEAYMKVANKRNKNDVHQYYG
jgi:hypothetical protein